MDDDETTRIRIRFAKSGDLRLVSHHDLMRCWERALRRASMPMAYSQGYNPRPKMVFPLALALGLEGHREVFECELSEPLKPSEVRDRLAAVCPPGLTILEAEAAGSGRAGRVASVDYRLPLPPDRQQVADQAVKHLLAQDHCPYQRQKADRTITIDVRPFVLAAEVLDDEALWFRLRFDPGGSIRPEEVLEVLGLRDLLNQGAVLVRTDVVLATDS